MTDRLEQLYRMLECENWPKPVRDGNYLIVDGEVYAWVTDEPLEERTYKPLFWRFE